MIGNVPGNQGTETDEQGKETVAVMATAGNRVVPRRLRGRINPVRAGAIAC